MKLPEHSRLVGSLQTMIEMQDKLNRKVDENWTEAGFEWGRAVWIECAELMDHIGWKWWSRQEPDMAQARMEVVDIWHFVLSGYIANRAGLPHWNMADAMAKRAENWHGWDSPPGHRQILEAVETMAHRFSDPRSDVVPGMLFLAMTAIGMTWDDLHRGYLGKNVLNAFRQDNGYSDGTYRKTWHGEEDNVHLDRILDGMGDAVYGRDAADSITKLLSEKYRQVLADAGDGFHKAAIYRKKPVEIEAFRMTERRMRDNEDWPNWLHAAWNGNRGEPGTVQLDDATKLDNRRFEVVTLEGVMAVNPGDWIIKGIAGELYPCKDDIFRATYESAR